jgi:pyruvate dehydrogenase E1 component alpha subunit
MYNCAKEAIERARNGGGPTLIEAKTFRFQGHVFGDVDGYMDKGEKDAWIAKDPVPLFRAWLIATGNASEDQLATLEATIERDIDEALEFTLSSPYPDIAELSRDIYKDEVSA